MARWKPDARGRLMGSALQLYAERGFEQTTAAEIAQRAGVTERTFFRHFADKREVLFSGSSDLLDSVVRAITAAPASMRPIDVVVAAMEAGASNLEGNREYARTRAAVIAANPSLQERELLKLASMASAASAALRARGVAELGASLTAETGVTVFKIGFETWIGRDQNGEAASRAEGNAGGDAPGDFARCIRDAFDQLRTLTADA